VLKTPPPLLPSQWAEQFRYLPPSMTSEPGPWRNDRTPYLVGIMDAVAEPGVEVVVFLKAVQVGFSEGIRNVLGYFVDHEPGPTMLVMPSQQSAEESIGERVRPLLYETPALKRHMTGERSDDKLSAIRLDTMTLYTGWAGSPQALASRPIRYLLFDEVDKYPPFAGKEADPISLGMKRLTTFGHRARAIIGSTPTTRYGPVWTAWEDCTDRRRFYVPCPHCGHEQHLVWSRVKWPAAIEGESRKDHAERIESQRSATYECESCAKPWTNADKNNTVRLGKWKSEDGSTGKRRVGFHINSLYSPWISLSKLAGEWLRAQGNPSALMDFANSRLAEPFEEQMSRPSVSVIEAKAKRSGPPRVVPNWAQLLIATADVQKDHCYYVIRAWGHGYRSQLVSYGLASNPDEVRRIVFETPLPMASGEAAFAQVLGMDCGYRDTDVYALAQTDPGRIWPVMGESNYRAAPLVERAIKGYPGVIRRNINTNYWKDFLHGLIHSDDETQWMPHSEVGHDYIKQMASEHKIYDPRAGTWAWRKISEGADNHDWDCEVYQCVIAQLAGAGALPELEPERGAANGTTGDEPAAAWSTSHKGRW